MRNNATKPWQWYFFLIQLNKKAKTSTCRRLKTWLPQSGAVRLYLAFTTKKKVERLRFGLDM